MSAVFWPRAPYVQVNRHVDGEPLHGPAYDVPNGPRHRVGAWLRFEWDRVHAAVATICPRGHMCAS
jgi:hypothetical protein